jgi:hypothetical protein
MVLPNIIYNFFFLINIKINFYVFIPSLFKNYVYRTKNIIHIIKIKYVTMRSSPLYDVNFTVKTKNKRLFL